MKEKCNNDVLTAFFTDVLELICVIRNVYLKSDKEIINLQFNSKTYAINALSETFSQEVVLLFLLACNSSSSGNKCIEIFDTDDASTKCEIETNIKRYFKINKSKRYSIKNDIGSNVNLLRKVHKSVENAFLTSDKKTKLQNHLQDLISFYEKIDTQYKLIEKDTICSFLDMYYQLLLYLLFLNEALDNPYMINEILIPIIHLGSKSYSYDNYFETSITAPVSLHNLNLVYDELNKFITIPNETLQQEKERFLDNIYSTFQYFTIQDASHTPYIVSPALCDKTNGLILIGKPVTACDSYKHIELSKVYSFIDTKLNELQEEQNNKTYDITIFGEISSEETKKLAQHFNDILSASYTANIALKLSIYTVNHFDMSDFSLDYCECKFYKYSNQLLQFEQMKKILNKCDLFICLDSLDLYKIYIQYGQSDRLVLKQTCSPFKYSNNYKKDIYNCFSILYNAMTLHRNFLEVNLFKISLNKYLIDFIKNYASQKNKSAYILLSLEE